MNVCLTPYGAAVLFFKVAVPIHILLVVYERSSCSTTSSKFGTVQFLFKICILIVYFKIELFVFQTCSSSLCILETSPLTGMYFAKNLLLDCGLPFCFLKCLIKSRFLFMIKYILLIFSFSLWFSCSF